MTENKASIPCIVCGAQTERVSDYSPINQPHGATAFTSEGHYGSTVFDPIGSGEQIHIVVCDSCLKIAAARQHVYWNRAWIPIEEDGWVIVGREWVHRPLVEWDPKTPHEKDKRVIEPEEAGDLYLSQSIEWTVPTLRAAHGRPADRKAKQDRIDEMNARSEPKTEN